MAMYLDRVGAESEPAPFTWGPRDCSLYALAIGAGVEDVAFTTEGNAGAPQRVYPSFAFAVVAALADEWPDPCFGTGDFSMEQAVLGEQSLRIHRPLGEAGAVTTRTRVAAIHDKGSGALVVLDQEALDTATGEPVFTSTVGMFIMGEGGFGAPDAPDLTPAPRPAPRPEPRPEPRRPERAPDLVVDAAALPVQTLLYRHAGNDANPVHVDPVFARRAGWAGPILTGQNVLGFACRALVDATLDGDPDRLRSLGGRFAEPAYNGDVLRTEIWADPEPRADPSDSGRAGEALTHFRVLNGAGVVLVDRGHARSV